MMQRNLVYTIAYDDKGRRTFGNLAKLLASSVVRSGFDGQMVIFHNGEQPLFQLARTRVDEVPIDLVDHQPSLTATNMIPVVEQRWALKHRISSILLEEYEWDRLLFIDADCLVIRSLDDIFAGDFQLGVYREKGRNITRENFNCFLTEAEMETLQVDGINSGVVCVDRSIAPSFFAAWEEAETRTEQRFRWCTDQAALNRVVLDHDYVLKDLTPWVGMPYHTNESRHEVEFGKSIMHWVGSMGEEKLKASFGLFAQTYLFDPSLTLFNLMEP